MSTTTLSPAPMQSPIVLAGGGINPVWATWFQALYNRVGQANAPTNTYQTTLAGSITTLQSQVAALQTPTGPVPLKSYLKAAVPSASANTGKMIYVSDSTGGAFAYLSNGTSWLNMATAAVLA